MTDDDRTVDDEATADDGLAGETESAVANESEPGAETWEPRPLPDLTPETEAFWSAGAAGKLLLCECPDCGLVYHYPRALCPDCFSDEVTWREATGTGTVYSYSIARQVSGWPEEALPLVVAYVELDDGPRMMTNVVDCDSGAIEIGTAVQVRFVSTTNPDVAIPVFAPSED